MISKELLAHIRKIEIRTRRMVEEVTAGAYHSVFKGSGIEFEEVREYTPEDDVRNIDWNVTAKMGNPYIKKYIEERELNVMLLVDASASGYFGSGKKTKLETAVEIASVLSFSAIRNHDKVGLMMFTDKTELYLPPNSGRLHCLRLIRELLARKPDGVKTDIASALENAMRVLHKKSIIFLISDMISDENYQKLLTVANKRHDVVAVRVLDPKEVNLPVLPGITISDIESGEKDYFCGGRKAGENYNSAVAELHSQNKTICDKAKVDLIDIKCGDDLTKPLMKFFRKRERLAQRG
ncbi:MAG: DUF58 domain-containing protein [Victivallales bacterium]|nr:DUF58 domain-containing protein [Victivallales bacterium]